MPPSAAFSGTTSSGTTQVMSSRHQDYIHDCAFDVYGRRMATCSGDRFVRVWDLTDNGEWSLVGEWQAHKGSVSMLRFAHPEFGSLIATGGSDHEAKIWEERTNATSAGSRFTAKAQLTEARKAVSCLEFSPRHFGLKLAAGSADG
jgi:nucleoporin SEH1